MCVSENNNFTLKALWSNNFCTDYYKVLGSITYNVNNYLDSIELPGFILLK